MCFKKFGEQGASANAFTSFTRTSYLFSTTDQLELNLGTLLDFVQAPYFTEESVQKSKESLGKKFKCIKMIRGGSSFSLF